jgi:hypothetical protein
MGGGGLRIKSGGGGIKQTSQVLRFKSLDLIPSLPAGQTAVSKGKLKAFFPEAVFKEKRCVWVVPYAGADYNLTSSHRWLWSTAFHLSYGKGWGGWGLSYWLGTFVYLSANFHTSPWLSNLGTPPPPSPHHFEWLSYPSPSVFKHILFLRFSNIPY